MSNDLKAIKITYAEAERRDKSKKLLRKIRCRIKGGSVHDELVFSFRALLGGRRSKATSVRFGEPLFHIFSQARLQTNYYLTKLTRKANLKSRFSRVKIHACITGRQLKTSPA